MPMSRLVYLLFAVAAPLGAQWIKITNPGIPRTPDGKPNLSAPTPRTPDGKPDLSGIWQMNGKYLQDIAADMKAGDVPYQPWALTAFNERQGGARGKDDPAASCLP